MIKILNSKPFCSYQSGVGIILPETPASKYWLDRNFGKIIANGTIVFDYYRGDNSVVRKSRSYVQLTILTPHQLKYELERSHELLVAAIKQGLVELDDEEQDLIKNVLK